MTDHIQKSYSDGTKIDLYIQRPGRNWGRVIALSAFILMGIAAMSQGQGQVTAGYHPAFSGIPEPATPWYVYVGIAMASLAGISLILLGTVWLISQLMSRKSSTQAPAKTQPAQPAETPLPGIEIEKHEVAARARIIDMRRRAS